MNAIVSNQSQSFPALLKQHQAEIARALPRHINPDRMARIALTEFRKNPKLGECDPRSVFAAIILASQLGLEPGILGQCYLIPYKTECQLIPGYQGLLDLARRTGRVKRIEAQVVYDRDRFTYRTGLSIFLEHEPMLDGDRGDPRLAYAVAEFADGGYHVEVMSRSEIESIRDRSSGVQMAKRFGKKTPWDTDPDQMWRKTVLRRLCKFLPKSVELAQALSLDDSANRGSQGITVREAVSGEWSPPAIADSSTDGQEYPAMPALPPPDMNPETGEVPMPVHTPETQEPPTAPEQGDPCAEILAQIAEAKVLADLDALSKAVGKLRNGERTKVVTAWRARKAELSGPPSAT